MPVPLQLPLPLPLVVVPLGNAARLHLPPPSWAQGRDRLAVLAGLSAHMTHHARAVASSRAVQH